MIDAIASDVRYSLRIFGRHPVYAAATILTLALGIGANALVYALASAVFIHPLPFARGDELVKVTGKRRLANGEMADFAVTAMDFIVFSERNRTLSGVGAILAQSFSVSIGDEPRMVRGGSVSASMWPVLGVPPVAGRAFTASEDTPNAAVAMISETLQQRLFPGPPARAVGQHLSVDGIPRVIVGVMRAGVTPAMIPSDVWVPLGVTRATVTPAANRIIQLVGRLKPGVSIAQARADIERVARDLEAEFPDTHRGDGGNVVSLRTKIADGAESLALTLLASVLFLLVLACANVANLTLARVARRRAEISTRLALGGPRAAIVRQQLCESILIGVAGGLIGALLATVVLPVLMRMTAGGSFILALVTIDWRVMLMVVGASIAAGAGCAIVPVLYGIRMSASGPLAGGGRRNQSGVGDARVRRLLMSGQVAVAAVLLVGAFGMVATLRRLAKADVGFRPEQVIVANLTLPQARYGKLHERVALVDRVLEQLSATPGIRGVGVSSNPFVRGQVMQTTVSIEGQPATTDAQLSADLRRTAGSYFSVLSIPISRGRDFTTADRDSTLPVAVVNRAFVKQYFGGGDALGKRIKRGAPTNPWLTIVGIVPDIMDRGVGVVVGPTVYVPFRQSAAPEFSFVLSTTMGTAAAERALRAAIASVDADRAIESVKSLPQLLDESVGEDRFKTVIIAALAALALVLASTGIYGVTSFLVAERTREIAIRMALGARAATVLRQLVVDGGRWIVSAAAVGLVAARLLGGAVARYVPQLTEAAVGTYATTAVLLTAVGIAATAIPTWRASRVSPAQVLRGE